jgi:hypothetical protein
MLFQIHAGKDPLIAEAVGILQQGAQGNIPPKEEISAVVEKLAAWTPP